MSSLPESRTKCEESANGGCVWIGLRWSGICVSSFFFFLFDGFLTLFFFFLFFFFFFGYGYGCAAWVCGFVFCVAFCALDNGSSILLLR